MFRFSTFVIMLALLAAAMLAAAYADFGETPHEFTDNDCFFCHFTIPADGRGGGMYPDEPLEFMDTISNLCGGCHEMSATVSHCVDIVPAGAAEIPPDMPLDSEGKMTCVTCHDIHKPYKNALTGQRTFFLRREPAGAPFCLSCHNNEQSIQMVLLEQGYALPDADAFTHRPAMDRGHGFAGFEVTDLDTEIDDLSKMCLDCHDDPGAPQRTSPGARMWRHANESIGMSHPIGSDYYRATMDHDGLVPERDLDTRLRLFDGRLGCCTCHDPYMPGGGQGLVIGSRDSYQDLCFSCHDM